MTQAEVVAKLLETNTRLTEQIIELSKALVEAREPQFPAAGGYPALEHAPFPLNMPESEEDAEHLLKMGMITEKEFEGIKREIEFYDDEMYVPTGT